MTLLKAIIVDDEPLARTSLERLCSKTDVIQHLDSCESAEQALEKIKAEEVDLIFLDIEMPGMSGIELLDVLPYMPQVIFTTSKIEYAFEAFEYDVTDYLKKPITQARFTKAVEKATEIKERLERVASGSAAKELYIKTDGRFIRLPYDSILYFENVGDYVKVITEEGKNHIIYGALKAIDARLSYPRFLKVHRSFIVNLDKIKDIEDNTLVIEKSVIPISRAFKPVLMNNLNIL